MPVRYDDPTPQPRLPRPSQLPSGRAPQESRREGGMPDGLLLGLICFLLGVTVLVWTGTGLGGLLEHGRWPAALHFTRTPVAMRELATHPLDLSAAWPQVPTARLPRPGLFWGILIGQVMVLLVLVGFAVGTITRFRAVRAARRAKPCVDVAPPTPVAARTPAAAQAVAVQQPVAPAAPENAVQPSPAVEPVADRPLGTRVLFASGGAARAVKGEQAVWPAVLEAEGAVVVTCADDMTWRQTMPTRAKFGPVHVFDPEHLVDTPGRLRWAPHSGCERPATALARARALLAPLRSHDVTADDAAVTLLRCWLHAAAVDGLPFRQLHRWAGGSGAADAVRILRTARDAASGWSGELESTLHAHPERRDAAQAAIRLALSGLDSLHIRDACGPGRSEVLDLESFVNERGTLYVVGTPREDPRTDPGAMPLLAALVSSVVEHGRRVAGRSSPGRLDPPVTLVLDDVATVAPLPELPALMAEGEAIGVAVLAVLRSEEQARHRWPAREAPAIWQRAGSRVDL
jgi:TraM recognition site of TraD and TraG